MARGVLRRYLQGEKGRGWFGGGKCTHSRRGSKVCNTTCECSALDGNHYIQGTLYCAEAILPTVEATVNVTIFALVHTLSLCAPAT